MSVPGERRLDAVWSIVHAGSILVFDGHYSLWLAGYLFTHGHGRKPIGPDDTAY